MCAHLLSHGQLLHPHRLYATKRLCPWQEYWNGWPLPSPGDLPDPGIQPISPALQLYSLLLSPQRSPVTIKIQTKLTSMALPLLSASRGYFLKSVSLTFLRCHLCIDSANVDCSSPLCLVLYWCLQRYIKSLKFLLEKLMVPLGDEIIVIQYQQIQCDKYGKLEKCSDCCRMEEVRPLLVP